MEMVNRYVAAVQRELPRAKQQEIGRELKANIMDKIDALSEQQGPLNEQDIAELLINMGHPRTVARQFVPLQPLFSTSLMPLYKHTMFMVLGILFLLQVVDSTAAWLSATNSGLLWFFHSLAGGFMEAACFAFTSITLGFMAMSLNSPEQGCATKRNWRPEQLPAAGPHWQQIPMSDIFTDLATYLFLLLVVWYPLWSADTGAALDSTLMSNDMRGMLQWVSPVIFLGVLNSLWQLRMRIWSKPLLLCNIALNGAATLIVLYLASNVTLINMLPDEKLWVFNYEYVEHSAMISLFIIALFPGWEVVRDIYRLKKL